MSVNNLFVAYVPQEFPIRSKLDPVEYGPSESAITKELLEEEIGGMSLEKVLYLSSFS